MWSAFRIQAHGFQSSREREEEPDKALWHVQGGYSDKQSIKGRVAGPARNVKCLIALHWLVYVPDNLILWNN